MILYNMRYRGPFEYDKFILNILQFHNEANQLFMDECNPINKNKARLINLHEEIKNRHTNIINKSEELYMKLLNYGE